MYARLFFFYYFNFLIYLLKLSYVQLYRMKNIEIFNTFFSKITKTFKSSSNYIQHDSNFLSSMYKRIYILFYENFIKRLNIEYIEI